MLAEEALGAVILWPAALLAIGVAAVAAGGFAATLRFGPAVTRGIALAAGAGFAGYAAAVLLVSEAFLLAIAAYLPAALFLALALAREYRRTGARPARLLYHLIQAAALWLLFLGAEGWWAWTARG